MSKIKEFIQRLALIFKDKSGQGIFMTDKNGMICFKSDKTIIRINEHFSRSAPTVTDLVEQTIKYSDHHPSKEQPNTAISISSKDVS